MPKRSRSARRRPIADKSKVVCYRGCMLLAYSQKREVLPSLRHALEATDPERKADLSAAIDAIESENYNWLSDRFDGSAHAWTGARRSLIAEGSSA